MPYTVWSHGRLVGHSELDCRVFRKHRMGGFHPTELGAKLMAVVTGVGPAGIDLARVIRAWSKRAENLKPSADSLEATLRQTSEYADLVAAENYRDALALELRAPNGSLVRTEWIDIRDTEFLLSLANEDDLSGDSVEGVPLSEDDLGDDFGAGEEWRGQEVPRYQLQVMLRD